MEKMGKSVEAIQKEIINSWNFPRNAVKLIIKEEKKKIVRYANQRIIVNDNDV